MQLLCILSSFRNQSLTTKQECLADQCEYRSFHLLQTGQQYPLNAFVCLLNWKETKTTVYD